MGKALGVAAAERPPRIADAPLPGTKPLALCQQAGRSIISGTFGALGDRVLHIALCLHDVFVSMVLHCTDCAVVPCCVRVFGARPIRTLVIRHLGGSLPLDQSSLWEQGPVSILGTVSADLAFAGECRCYDLGVEATGGYRAPRRRFVGPTAAACKQSDPTCTLVFYTTGLWATYCTAGIEEVFVDIFDALVPWCQKLDFLAVEW